MRHPGNQDYCRHNGQPNEWHDIHAEVSNASELAMTMLG
jgi:hypothetical protein